MKLKHILVACFSLALLAVASCKKDDKPKTTAEKLQGKWTLENVIDNEHTSGEDSKDTTMGTGAEYFDFRPDGKLYVSFDGELDSASYALQNDAKIIITQLPFAAIYDIQALTENDLKLYTKENDPDNPADYYEEIIDFKK